MIFGKFASIYFDLKFMTYFDSYVMYCTDLYLKALSVLYRFILYLYLKALSGGSIYIGSFKN